MKKSLKYREMIGDSRRIVVKIGSRVLVQKNGRPDVQRIKRIIKELAKLKQAGYEVAVITSGAIGAGMATLGMKTRPSSLPELQMAAAVGQCKLMSLYAELFSKSKCKVGQILLTHADFHHKIRMTNAKRTIQTLLKNNVIPIINENDVVADEEIKADLAVGDNDLLASMVVKLIRADLLIMLTTVNGVLEQTASGRSRRIKYIEAITRKTLALAKISRSKLSKGGMASKLRAAQASSKAGCSVVIANGRTTGILTEIMEGKDVGTLII